MQMPASTAAESKIDSTEDNMAKVNAVLVDAILPGLQRKEFVEALLSRMAAAADRGLLQRVTNMKMTTYSYTGTVNEEHKPHGQGIQLLDNGDVYEGNFCDGMKQGIGIYTWMSGNFCAGKWVQDKAVWPLSGGGKNEGGEVVDRWIDSYRFTGAINLAGKPHGKGTQKLQNGDSFEGSFCDGLRHGIGIYTWASGNTCASRWVQDKIVWPLLDKIETIFYDGDGSKEVVNQWIDCYRYTGTVNAKGKPHGGGSQCLRNGDKYHGSFCDGLRHGQGTCKWANGNMYTGEWVANRMHGKGQFKWANGNTYDGGWIEDRRNGFGEFQWADGQWAGDKYVGDYINGRRHGHGIYMFADGSKYDGGYVNDLRHGTGTFIWADGKRYVGGYVADKKHGNGTATHADGRVFHSGRWVDGCVPALAAVIARASDRCGGGATGSEM